MKITFNQRIKPSNWRMISSIRKSYLARKQWKICKRLIVEIKIWVPKICNWIPTLKTRRVCIKWPKLNLNKPNRDWQNPPLNTVNSRQILKRMKKSWRMKSRATKIPKYCIRTIWTSLKKKLTNTKRIMMSWLKRKSNWKKPIRIWPVIKIDSVKILNSCHPNIRICKLN